MKVKALSRLKALAKGESDISPDMIMAALASGLATAVGPLKPITARIPGKYESKVYIGQAGKGNTFMKMLKGLDFSAIKLDNQRIATGVRVEVNGKSTYVNYNSLNGLVTITSNADSIDI